jgi:hypothetical protein
MKDLEPGLIVSVPELPGQYVVLRVNLMQCAAVLLSRDGKKTIVRDVPLQMVHLVSGQMQAWTNWGGYFGGIRHACTCPPRKLARRKSKGEIV